MEKGFCSIPVERLVKADWNYKVNNEELSKKLTENIKRNGQIENIIVRDMADGKFEIVNGNHRLDTLIELGYKDVYCYNLGDISETQAKRIAIETNETRFDSDYKSLSAIVKELVDDFDINELLETLPYMQHEIDVMLNLDDKDNDNVEEIQDINDSSFTEKCNFIIECNSVTQLSELQKMINTEAQKISFDVFVEAFNER